jgi:antibiotic biosynthesis monooxygenase (ABM) superfamily enzyme
MAEPPVTIVVRRRIRAGRESAYEQRLEALLRGAAALPGYLGAQIARPAPGAAPEYTSVFRFDTLDNLRAFEESPLRRAFLADVAPLSEMPAQWKQMTGLEFWFTPPAGALVPQPSRWRMCVLLIVVVYLMVLSIGSLVGWGLRGWPFELRLLVTIIIEVILMTYLLMPRLTRWLARWIYPAPRSPT